MSHNNSSTSEEQPPEIFRRLGKTVPPRDRRYYSARQQTTDKGLRIVRPIHHEQQPNATFHPHQPSFQHPNYSNMVIQTSTPPPLYYRPQMNNDNHNVMGFHANFGPNNNDNTTNSNNNNNYTYQSPPPSASSTPPTPQNAFSFIPKDAISNPNPNPIISFVRKPNASYQMFNGGGNMSQVSTNNGQQVLQTSPPVATASPSSSVSATSTVPTSVPIVTTSGTTVTLPESSHAKKDSSVSPEKATVANTPSSRKSEQKKATKSAPVDNRDSSHDKKENTPTNYIDILAKSIQIIASRPLGKDKNGGNANRKHARHSDSEESESDKDLVPSTINRKVVVAAVAAEDDTNRDTSREKSPIRKKAKRSISPTISKRRRSLSAASDGGTRSSRGGKTALPSPSPMSVDRRSRSRSRSHSRSRSQLRRRRRSISRSRSRSISRSRSCSRSRLTSLSRSRSRSRSRSPPRRRRRRRSESTQRQRDYSPGSSSDEEKAPFQRREADRYVPDYNRRPLPPQYRQRSPYPPAVGKLSSPTILSSANDSSRPLAKESVADSTVPSINNRLNQNQPKVLRAYPPLGTIPVAFDNSRIKAHAVTSSPTITASSGSEQATAKKSVPISHKIITKPSPNVLKAKSPTTATAGNNNSPAATTAAQPKPLPRLNKPKSNIKMIPIKQETIVESINNTTIQNNGRADGMTGGGSHADASNDSTCATPNSSSFAISSKQSNAPAAAVTLKQPTTINPPVVTETAIIAEPVTQNPLRKRRIFSDSPLADSVEANKSADGSSLVIPLVNGTDPIVTLNTVKPNKNSVITQATRAAIKMRAAKEQERLDQERLRQLDIDDRDDIVMDIALPNQSCRSPAARSAYNAIFAAGTLPRTSPAADHLVATNNTQTTLRENTQILAEPNSVVDSNKTTVLNGNLSLKNSSVFEILPINMTSHESVPSTVDTNSGAFTSSNIVSVPGTDLMEQSKSMSLHNSQLLSPPASLQREPLTVVEKPLVQAIKATPPSVSVVPLKKKNNNKKVPAPWKVKMSDSGDIYYHNPITGEETSVRPE